MITTADFQQVLGTVQPALMPKPDAPVLAVNTSRSNAAADRDRLATHRLNATSAERSNMPLSAKLSQRQSQTAAATPSVSTVAMSSAAAAVSAGLTGVTIARSSSQQASGALTNPVGGESMMPSRQSRTAEMSSITQTSAITNPRAIAETERRVDTDRLARLASRALAADASASPGPSPLSIATATATGTTTTTTAAAAPVTVASSLSIAAISPVVTVSTTDQQPKKTNRYTDLTPQTSPLLVIAAAEAVPEPTQESSRMNLSEFKSKDSEIENSRSGSGLSPAAESLRASQTKPISEPSAPPSVSPSVSVHVLNRDQQSESSSDADESPFVSVSISTAQSRDQGGYVSPSSSIEPPTRPMKPSPTEGSQKAPARLDKLNLPKPSETDNDSVSQKID